MSRAIAGTLLPVWYKTEVTSITCAHHVYKEVWDAAIEAALNDRE